MFNMVIISRMMDKKVHLRSRRNSGTKKIMTMTMTMMMMTMMMMTMTLTMMMIMVFMKMRTKKKKNWRNQSLSVN